MKTKKCYNTIFIYIVIVIASIALAFILTTGILLSLPIPEKTTIPPVCILVSFLVVLLVLITGGFLLMYYYIRKSKENELQQINNDLQIKKMDIENDRYIKSLDERKGLEEKNSIISKEERFLKMLELCKQKDVKSEQTPGKNNDIVKNILKEQEYINDVTLKEVLKHYKDLFGEKNTENGK